MTISGKRIPLILKRQRVKNIVVPLRKLYALMQTDIAKCLHIAQLKTTGEELHEHDDVFYLVSYHNCILTSH